MLKLHVGCGERYLPGYVHVDSRKLPRVDVVCDVESLLEHFGPASVGEIYHCALLEHLPRDRVLPALRRFHYLLKPGGRLVSSVPNFASIVEAYRRRIVPLEGLFGMLYGKSDYPGNMHHGMFDFDLMLGLLAKSGFVRAGLYDWRTFLPEGYDDFSRAYMPHMDFENGMPMMLNVMADKQ